jgi:hypothetical protein
VLRWLGEDTLQGRITGSKRCGSDRARGYGNEIARARRFGVRSRVFEEDPCEGAPRDGKARVKAEKAHDSIYRYPTPSQHRL